MGCGLSLAGLMVMLMPVLGVLVVLGVDRRRGAFLVFSSRSSPSSFQPSSLFIFPLRFLRHPFLPPLILLPNPLCYSHLFRESASLPPSAPSQ